MLDILNSLVTKKSNEIPSSERQWKQKKRHNPSFSGIWISYLIDIILLYNEWSHPVIIFHP